MFFCSLQLETIVDAYFNNSNMAFHVMWALCEILLLLATYSTFCLMVCLLILQSAVSRLRQDLTRNQVSSVSIAAIVTIVTISLMTCFLVAVPLLLLPSLPTVWWHHTHTCPCPVTFLMYTTIHFTVETELLQKWCTYRIGLENVLATTLLHSNVSVQVFTREPSVLFRANRLRAYSGYESTVLNVLLLYVPDF